MSKKYCSIHHLYYTSVECPMCLKDRVSIYEKKYGLNQETVKEQKESEREITDEDLSKLINKFNVK